MKYSPPILYTKGNEDLLNDSTIAVVGSRKATKQGLDFTNNIAKNAVSNHEVVVSGFGVIDREALDKTLEANGRSIIVLPRVNNDFFIGY